MENSQKSTLNLYFKSRFFVKPRKFLIYFAHDCRILLIPYAYVSIELIGCILLLSFELKAI